MQCSLEFFILIVLRHSCFTTPRSQRFRPAPGKIGSNLRPECEGKGSCIKWYMFRDGAMKTWFKQESYLEDREIQYQRAMAVSSQ